MSYVVLARKWRPQKFDDLVGQEAITKTLQNAIELQRVSHALLFTGPRGVGKTTTARLLAKALNCVKGPIKEPCGECENCREIAAGSSVDVLEIDGASNTSVEDVRDLKENVRYQPAKSKHKIYIIDEVHMLSTSAFNALLKTLEEPPPGVMFVFATTEPQKIPETILSRCQRFDFIEVQEARLSHHLQAICEKESLAFEPGAISLIAKQAHGSVRDALSLLDQVIAFTGEKGSEIEVARILGLADRELIDRTLQAFVTSDTNAALSTLDDVMLKGFDPKTYVVEIWEKVRDFILLQTGVDHRILRSSQSEIERYQEWVKDLDSKDLERWFGILSQTATEVGRAEFPRLLLEMSFLKITRKADRIPWGQVLERLETLEKKLGAGGVSYRDRSGGSGSEKFEESKTSSRDSGHGDRLVSNKSVPPIARGLVWDELVQEVKSRRPSVAAILLQAHHHEVSFNELTLFFEEESFYWSRAEDSGFQEFIKEVCREKFGVSPTIVVKGNRSEKSEVSRVSLEKDLQKEALENPMIKKAVSLFGAKVEEIKALD